MASTLPIDRARPAEGKTAFVNRARRFAKTVAGVTRLPGFPLLWISSAAAAVLAIVTGAFNTDSLPLGTRSLFWTLLLGWTLAKWQTWFAFTVRKPEDWTRASLIGALPLNLLIPVETWACIRAVGIQGSTDPVRNWLYALIISTVLFAVIWTATRRVAATGREARAPAGPPVDGLLARAGIAPDGLLAIQAEDHYCRVTRRDGSSTLVHYRFADALAELAALDGAQVHRGIWVAAGAVHGAVRERRRWRLLLSDGRPVPVSASHLDAVRRRGWLRRPSSTASALAPQSAVALASVRP